jgi:hypothetical protein
MNIRIAIILQTMYRFLNREKDTSSIKAGVVNLEKKISGM